MLTFQIRDNTAIFNIKYKNKLYECLFDIQDAHNIVNNFKIVRLRKSKNNLYVIGIKSNSKLGEFTLLHRYVMNFPENLVIDHIYHNTLDNRKHFLRAVSNSENSTNKKFTKSIIIHKLSDNIRVHENNNFIDLKSFEELIEYLKIKML